MRRASLATSLTSSSPTAATISISRTSLTQLSGSRASARASTGTAFRAARIGKTRLGALIRDADTIVFVLSPSSARSPICAWEVEEAFRLGKRILPVLCRSLEGANPPPQLAALSYVYFYAEPKSRGSGFGSGLAQLVSALNMDLEWLREHTRYLQRATEWDQGSRPAHRLLFGPDITTAKAWAVRRPKNSPEPTALQLDFIKASEIEDIHQKSVDFTIRETRRRNTPWLDQS